MSLTTNTSITQLLIALNGQVTTTGGLANPTLPISFPGLINLVLTNGTNAANKVGPFYSTVGTLAASSTVDIDLYALGGATDIGGNAFTMAKLKFLFFQLIGATVPVEADYVILGNKGTTAGWAGSGSFFQVNTDSGKIFTGGFVALGDPGATAYAVGNSTTNHILTLTSGANSGPVTYNFITAGTNS